MFEEGVRAYPEDPIWGMGAAFRELLERREELQVLLHGFAAAGDPEIGDAVRQRYADLYNRASELSDADPERMKPYWSHGMLLIVAAAIDLPSMEGKEGWIHELLNRGERTGAEA